MDLMEGVTLQVTELKNLCRNGKFSLLPSDPFGKFASHKISIDCEYCELFLYDINAQENNLRWQIIQLDLDKADQYWTQKISKPLLKYLAGSLCWSILFKGKLRIPVLEEVLAGSNIQVLIHQNLTSNSGLLFNLTSFPQWEVKIQFVKLLHHQETLQGWSSWQVHKIF